VHGFSLDTRMWDDQFEHLAQDYHVIRYDLRGFGQSSLPTQESYSHGEDLHALLVHLGVEAAYLVGQSMGGECVVDFALTYPDTVRALILIDCGLSGFPWSQSLSALMDAIWKQATEGGTQAAKDTWLAHPFFAQALCQPMVAARLKQSMADYSGWHFVSSDPRQGIEPPAIQRLNQIKVPMLIIVGENDVLDFLAMSDFLAQHVPNARKVLVAGAGHMVNMEAPDQINEAILHFLRAL
jgi:pimeloyl-ACP methyl ester carboxylesterase